MDNTYSLELTLSEHYGYGPNGSRKRRLKTEIEEWCEQTIGPWEFGPERSRLVDEPDEDEDGFRIKGTILYDSESDTFFEARWFATATRTSIHFESEADKIVFQLRWL